MRFIWRQRARAQHSTRSHGDNSTQRDRHRKIYGSFMSSSTMWLLWPREYDIATAFTACTRTQLQFHFCVTWITWIIIYIRFFFSLSFAHFLNATKQKSVAHFSDHHFVNWIICLWHTLALDKWARAHQIDHRSTGNIWTQKREKKKLKTPEWRARERERAVSQIQLAGWKMARMMKMCAHDAAATTHRDEYTNRITQDEHCSSSSGDQKNAKSSVSSMIIIFSSFLHHSFIYIYFLCIIPHSYTRW